MGQKDLKNKMGQLKKGLKDLGSLIKSTEEFHKEAKPEDKKDVKTEFHYEYGED